MNANLFFRPQPSMIYRGYLIFTHLFALLCVWSVLPLGLSSVFIWLLLGSFLYYFYRHQNIVAFEYSNKTEWILECTDHPNERALLLPSSVMMPYFLILHFKGFSGTRRKTIVLFSDSFSSADFRSLRCCVKVGYL
ncbi:MAG TPA: protein YgfX [Gammaproteobacteria bacterium]|nr:protein YgfX [Gammaproteobacteria bacterium]